MCIQHFLFNRKFWRNFLLNKRHRVPEMRTRAKMKDVASGLRSASVVA